MAGLKFDIVIAGKGLTGRIAAIAMARLGFTVALIEKTCRKDNTPRLYAISPPNWLWLGTLGLIDETTLATPAKTMIITSISGRQLRLSSDMARRPALAYFIDESVLIQKAHHLLGESAVTLLSDATIVDVHEQTDNVALFLEDKHLHGKLLIIADGVFSTLRGLIGIEADIHDYGEDAIVAEFLPEKSHQNEAWQWFGDQEVLACLPKEDGRISIVWSLKRNLALQYANPNALTHQLESKVSHRFGKLALTSPIARYPLHKVNAASLALGRFFLLGDAAHAIHPLAGYGLNLTLGDLRALAAILSNQTDPGAASLLLAMAKKRQLFDQTVSALVDNIHRYFTQQSFLGDGLFAVAKHVPVAQRALVRLALEDHAP